MLKNFFIFIIALIFLIFFFFIYYDEKVVLIDGISIYRKELLLFYNVQKNCYKNENISKEEALAMPRSLVACRIKTKRIQNGVYLYPLDLSYPECRKRELKNFKEALKFLDSYRWSSHLDYCGKKNFLSVTQRKFLLDYFEG
jgi:hypothetical protein